MTATVTRIARTRRGATLGACLGLLYFIGDLGGALLAIGELFDPQAAAILLVAMAGVLELLVATAAGGLIGLLWPERIALRLKPWQAAALAIGLTLAVAAGGYLIRVGRTAVDLEPRPVATARQPLSVLWIVVDTLRADTLYGERFDFPLTPSLRRFASESLIFTDAEAAAGWTIPSVATLMTGIHPVSLYSARRFLPAWAPTAAERLRAAGYETRAFVDNALLERRNGFAQGFESFRQRSGFRFAFSLPGFRLLPSAARELLRELLPVAYEGSARVTQAALHTLSDKRDSPLFMYVHYMDVHHPFYPHPEIDPEVSQHEPARMHFLVQRLRDDPDAKPTVEQIQQLRRSYNGEIRALDRNLGKLLDRWRQTMGEQSLVVVTSDHGEEFLEHGELGHGHNLYRELVHVPLIMRFPPAAAIAIPPGTRVTHPVGQVDLLPTTLEVVGVVSHSGGNGVSMQGSSWVGWLTGKQAPPSRALFATQSHYKRRIYRWREGDWANVTTFFSNTDEVRRELFNLADDPGETRNEIDNQTETFAAMNSRSETFMRAQEADRDPQPVSLSENLDALRALGYVQ